MTSYKEITNNNRTSSQKFLELFKDTFIFALGNFGSKIVLFFLVPLYTNYLTTEEYGSADLIFTVSQLLYPVVSLCIFEGVLRMGLKRSIRTEDTLLCALTIWIIGVFVVLIITPFLTHIKTIANWKWYLAFYTELHVLCAIELNYLKAKGKNVLFALSSVLQTLILALLNVYLIVYKKAGINGFLLANTSSLFFQSILIFFSGKLYKAFFVAHFSYPLLKQMLDYSAPLIFNAISWWIIDSSDKLMIGMMLTVAQLGIFTVATKIPALINIFINIFTQAWVISSIKEIEMSLKTEFYSKVFLFYSFFITFASLVVISILKPFMVVYIGSDFLSAYHYAPFLILSSFFSSFVAFFGALMGALQISKKTMTTTLWGASINIVLNYVLIQVLGIWGAVIGTVCAYSLIAFLRIKTVFRFLDISFNLSTFLFDICSVMFLAFVVSFFDKYTLVAAVFTISAFLAINNRILFASFRTAMSFLKKISGS